MYENYTEREIEEEKRKEKGEKDLLIVLTTFGSLCFAGLLALVIYYFIKFVRENNCPRNSRMNYQYRPTSI